MKQTKQKSIKLWVTLLVLPIPLLILNAIVLAAVKSAADDTASGGLLAFINVLSLIIGLVSIMMLIGFPVWIVMLIKTINENTKTARK